MLKEIEQFIIKLSKLGQKSEFNEVERANNILLNQIQMIVVVLFVVIMIKDIIAKAPDAIATLISLLMGLSFFLLRHLISYRTAVLIQNTLFVITTAGYYYLYGDLIRIEVVFIISILMGTFLLPNWKLKVFNFFSILLLYAVVSYLKEFYPHNVNVYIGPQDNYILFLFALVVTFIFASRYVYVLVKMLNQKTILVQSLKENNAELERFAYSTSHDLKEPVRNIGRFAGLLRQSINQPGNYEKKSEHLEIIESSANHMNTLIDEILKYSKIEKDGIEIRDVSLSDIVENYIESEAVLIEGKNVSIEVKSLPNIKGNPFYLSMLFQNLLENSIKFNNTKNPTIKIEGQTIESGKVISISDNGIGIDQKYKDSIFEPFKRLHSRNQYEGTGLGLSICKKIVDIHAGKIWVDPKNEQGTKIIISFPV